MEFEDFHNFIYNLISIARRKYFERHGGKFSGGGKSKDFI